MELNLLIDSNVALDVILKREPFFAMSRNVILLSSSYAVNNFVSATTVTDIYYIARRQIKKTRSRYGVAEKLPSDGESCQRDA